MKKKCCHVSFGTRHLFFLRTGKKSLFGLWSTFSIVDTDWREWANERAAKVANSVHWTPLMIVYISFHIFVSWRWRLMPIASSVCHTLNGFSRAPLTPFCNTDNNNNIVPEKKKKKQMRLVHVNFRQQQQQRKKIFIVFIYSNFMVYFFLMHILIEYNDVWEEAFWVSSLFCFLLLPPFPPFSCWIHSVAFISSALIRIVFHAMKMYKTFVLL